MKTPVRLLLPMRLPVLFFAIAFLTAAIGCGGAKPEATAASPGESRPAAQGQAAGASDDFAAVVRADRTFALADLETAGWKKSKQLSPETLKAATDVWYGFYDRRDIEVRIYGSHADATGPGVEAAKEAIGRSPNSNIGGGIITSLGNRTQYHAYVVAGNLVLLCEQTTEACLKLVQQVP